MDGDGYHLDGEDPPLGVILCADKGPQQVELLELDRGEIRAARHLLEKLPIAQMERRIEEVRPIDPRQ